MKIIQADKFFFENHIAGPGYLIMKEGKFAGYSRERPVNGKVLDYTGKWIAPGLVDTHIHGLLDYDVMDNDPNGLQTMSEDLLRCGVTSFLPTTLTASIQDFDKVVTTIGQTYETMTGAKIQGIFLEGPFFTEKHKGAQNPKYFQDPDIEVLKNWQTLSGGLIKKIAIAPERKGVAAFAREATKLGISVALAHSNATFEQAQDAVANGASIFVHTFNGMSPLHHREPGMVGAAMSLPNVYNEIICDGHHVHPQSAKILMDITGRDRMILVSDAMRAALMPEGNYQLGEFPVTVANGTATIASGSLAGSILTMIDAVKNVVDWGIATPLEAIRMASIVPAKSVGMDHLCGKIAHGYDADFLVLHPDLSLQATFVGGVKKYEGTT